MEMRFPMDPVIQKKRIKIFILTGIAGSVYVLLSIASEHGFWYLRPFAYIALAVAIFISLSQLRLHSGSVKRPERDDGENAPPRIPYGDAGGEGAPDGGEWEEPAGPIGVPTDFSDVRFEAPKREGRVAYDYRCPRCASADVVIDEETSGPVVIDEGFFRETLKALARRFGGGGATRLCRHCGYRW
jgi:hypothetical protein